MKQRPSDPIRTSYKNSPMKKDIKKSHNSYIPEPFYVPNKTDNPFGPAVQPEVTKSKTIKRSSNPQFFLSANAPSHLHMKDKGLKKKITSQSTLHNASASSKIVKRQSTIVGTSLKDDATKNTALRRIKSGCDEDFAKLLKKRNNTVIAKQYKPNNT